jgi:hypothetical protein
VVSTIATEQTNEAMTPHCRPTTFSISDQFITTFTRALIRRTEVLAEAGYLNTT